MRVIKYFQLVSRTYGWIKTAAMVKMDPVKYARSLGVLVGNDARLIGIDGGTFGSEPYLVRLGDHVTVAAGVHFITHDGGVWVFRQKEPDLDVVAPITVGNNVFIGLGSVILPGVSIADNVVVGAGSVVTKDVPTDTVVAGSPARVIRTIDEYYDRVRNKKVNLYGLDSTQKKKFLLARFKPGFQSSKPDSDGAPVAASSETVN